MCDVQKRQPTETESGMIGTTDRADEHWEETEQVCVFFREPAREGQVFHSLVSCQQIAHFRRVKLGVNEALA